MRQGILTIVRDSTEGGEGVLRNGLKASGPSGILRFHILGDLTSPAVDSSRMKGSSRISCST